MNYDVIFNMDEELVMNMSIIMIGIKTAKNQYFFLERILAACMCPLTSGAP